MKLRLVGFAAVLSVVQPCEAQEFTLPTGDEVEVFCIATGTNIHLDGRSLYERARQKLPKALKDKAPPDNPDAQAYFTGLDSLALAWRYSDKKSTYPPPLGTLTFGISDGTGWYTMGPGWGLMFGRTGECYGTGYHHVPRTAKDLTLHLYLRDSATPMRLVGSETIRNPRYNGSVGKLAKAPVPKSVTSGSLTVEIESFYTGLHLENVPDMPQTQLYVYKADPPTSSIEALLTGNRSAGKMPEQLYTALVFRPKINGMETTKTALARLLVVDSLGNEFNYGVNLYRSGTRYVAVGNFALPVSDGNYEFELLLMEQPELVSNDWVATPQLKPSPAGTALVERLKLGVREVTSWLWSDDDRLTVNAVPPGPFCVVPIDTVTSQVVNAEPIREPRHGVDPNRTEIQLLRGDNEKVAPITLRFAEPVERRVRFKGVPERP